MKTNLDDELSLEKIDDYNNKESSEKRNTVRLIVVALLIIGGIFAYLKSTSSYSDYEGTKEAPGITTTKK